MPPASVSWVVRQGRQSILAARVHQLLVFGSAFGAGMIDSVAGGGSLLSFPTVLWQDAVVMAMGAVLGGVGGAGLARRMGRAVVRRLVIAIGFGMAAALLVKAL